MNRAMPERIKGILERPSKTINRFTKLEYEYHQRYYRVLFCDTPVYTAARYRKNRQQFFRRPDNAI